MVVFGGYSVEVGNEASTSRGHGRLGPTHRTIRSGSCANKDGQRRISRYMANDISLLSRQIRARAMSTLSLNS